MKVRNDHDQLKLITDLCGSIRGNKSWPEAEGLRLYSVLQKFDNSKKRSTIRQKLGHVFPDENCLRLFEQLLTLNPAERISAKNALKNLLSRY